MLASITTRSSSASIQINGLATKYTTAKWPISTSASACYSGWIGVILVLLQNLIVTTKIGWKGLLTQWLMCWILCLKSSGFATWPGHFLVLFGKKLFF